MIISLYFKLVYTTRTANYDIDTNWTPLELYSNLKEFIITDFNIDNFELLDTTTYFDGKPEEKPKIEPVDNISLEQLYNNKIKYLSLYIRPI
jgi:hypothetical protein